MSDAVFVEPEDLDDEIDPEIVYDEDEVDIEDVSLPEEDGLSLQWEDRPVIEKKVRQPRKTSVPWEEFLAFLTVEENAGKTVRLFSFSNEDENVARKAALSKARAVRNRLVKEQPELEYLITVDPIATAELPTYNVYASYEGEASDELFAERQATHDRRVEQGKLVAATRVANRAATSEALAAE